MWEFYLRELGAYLSDHNLFAAIMYFELTVCFFYFMDLQEQPSYLTYHKKHFVENLTRFVLEQILCFLIHV